MIIQHRIRFDDELKKTGKDFIVVYFKVIEISEKIRIADS
jgi:hypothetical protein